GDPDSEIVREEYAEILADAEKSKHENVLDFRSLFVDRANTYRTLLLSAAAIFGQMSGNAVISYFMPIMLDQAGISDTHTQLLLNAINSLVSFAAALTGASLVDRLGRRPLLIWATLGAMLMFVLTTVCSALVENGSTNAALSAVSVAAIYLFGIIFSFAWTPMQALYPVEVISYKNRAKGMSLNNLLVNICGFYSNFATPAAMGAIGWKFYLVYIVWDAMEVLVIWQFFVETKGRTLEELDAVFEAPNPVKASLVPPERSIDATNIDTIDKA
ncbi:hypothetical protein HK405_015902, partial [Cladochytrium tenue]